ncbi:MAG: phage holin family protein [Duncaniella sp.]|nr:phage holin family protein [Duncaniella sp.]
MTLHTVTSLLIILFVQYAGVLLAVLADLVSGLRRARREEVRCTSRGLRRTVAKLSSYYLALFCLTVVDVMAVTSIIALDAMGRDTIPAFPYLTTLGSLSLALIEAKSIVENSPHRTDIFNALRLLAGMMRKAVSR